MGTDVAKKQKTWPEILEENRDQFAVALPKVGLTAERVMRIAWTTMRQNKALQTCDPPTVIGSIIQACELGLSVSNTLGHAYLVPFNNKKTGKKDCTLIVGYRGYIALMKRTGEITDAKSTVVYENEPLEMEAGSRPYLKHKPLPPNKRGKSIIGAYATVIFKDGASTFEWMWYDDIMKIKARSQARNDGPWITDEEEMIKKTPIRRIAKRVGISVELQKAAVIDEYNEVGIRTGDMLMAETAEEAQEIEASVKPAAIEEPKQPEPEKAKEPEPPPPPPPQEKKPEPAVEGEEMMTVAQKKSIQSLFKKFGIEAGEAQCKVLGVDILKIGKPVESIDGLTKKQAGKAIEVLQDIFGPSNNEPNQA